MNKTIIAAAVAAVTFMSCSERTNPLIVESNLPYGAVEFDKISSSDYMPAFKEGFREYKENIDKIAACTDAPTFQNTIERWRPMPMTS